VRGLVPLESGVCEARRQQDASQVHGMSIVQCSQSGWIGCNLQLTSVATTDPKDDRTSYSVGGCGLETSTVIEVAGR
jgi:hypothetical protein